MPSGMAPLYEGQNLASFRRKLIHKIVHSQNPNRAIRQWNHLPDQKRLKGDSQTLRSNLEASLPKRYSVQEDMTIGIPGHKKRPSKRKPNFAEPPKNV